MQKDAYTLILEAIERGDFKPGDRLVESELAERLGVSRTPVREALIRLSGDGLVVTLPNRTTIVAPVDIARAATCKACNAFLRSGEYDWVLSEITQTCE